MFKVICSIKKLALEEVFDQLPPHKNVASAVKEYNAVVKYYNCEPCSIYGFGLTSTNTKPSFLDIESAIEVCNHNILNPTNPLKCL